MLIIKQVYVKNGHSASYYNISIFDTGITYNNLYYVRKNIVANKIKSDDDSNKARIY